MEGGGGGGGGGGEGGKGKGLCELVDKEEWHKKMWGKFQSGENYKSCKPHLLHKQWLAPKSCRFWV